MAEMPGVNKAGRNLGKGTVSKARRLRRAHLQQPKSPERNSWGDDGWDDGDWWGGGWWEEQWWGDDWTGPWKDEWENWGWRGVRLKSKSPTPSRSSTPSRSPSNRGRKRDSRKGRPSSEDGRGERRLEKISEESNSSLEPLARGKKPRQRSVSSSSSWGGVKVWKKKEMLEKERAAWHQEHEKKQHHQLEAEKKEAEGHQEAAIKKEVQDTPAKGSKETTPDKGASSSEQGTTPEKGATPEKGISPKEEPTKEEAPQEEAQSTPEKGKMAVMIDFHNTLSVRDCIPPPKSCCC